MKMKPMGDVIKSADVTIEKEINGHTITLTVKDDRAERMQRLQGLITPHRGLKLAALTALGGGRLRVDWAKMPSLDDLRYWPSDAEVEHFYDGQAIPWRR
jgi:hypothetical protein